MIEDVGEGGIVLRGGNLALMRCPKSNQRIGRLLWSSFGHGAR